MSIIWYVLKSKPNKEDFVCQQLGSKELEYYFPYYIVIPVNPRSRTWKAYFPGYIFVRMDLDLIDHPIIQWMPGASGLVSFDGIPATVSDGLIQALKSRSKQDDENHEGARKFMAGDHVEILSGPFQGYEGIFDTKLSGNERVRILIELIRGKPFKVDLAQNTIQKTKLKIKKRY
jgi:transcriptional antiterminator RfaH